MRAGEGDGGSDAASRTRLADGRDADDEGRDEGQDRPQPRAGDRVEDADTQGTLR